MLKHMIQWFSYIHKAVQPSPLSNVFIFRLMIFKLFLAIDFALKEF